MPVNNRGTIRWDTGVLLSAKRWRWPAVSLAADGPCRYFLGLRNKTLLLAAENLRYASAEEAMAAEAVTMTPRVGTRYYFDVSEEKQSSEDEEPQERGL